MKISMIGAGQQGVSQGLAYARLNNVTEVVFQDVALETDIILAKAQEAGIAAGKIRFAGTIADAVAGAEMIGLNVPMSAFESCAAEIARHARAGAILYDNGSGKVQAIQDVRAGLGDARVHYVPLHILHGVAGAGAATADPDMYKGVTAAIMLNEARPECAEVLAILLSRIGVGTVRTDLSAEKHDEALGRFSHHNTFYQITLMRAFPDASIGGQPVQIEPFLSSTRVAKSGSVEQDGSAMWAPIARDNKAAILAAGVSVHRNLLDLSDAVFEGRYGDLELLLGEAADYVARIAEADSEGNPRVIEDIEGALHDLHAQGADDPYAHIGSHVAAPVFAAAASALAADDYEQAGGEPYRSINNPSFRDTVRPAHTTPDKTVDLVRENVDLVQNALTRLIETHEALLDAIAADNDAAIRTHIHEGNQARHRLPAHRANGRPQFSL